MLQAVVVGNVWSTKRIDGLPSGAFLEVEVTGSGERLVAFDVLGSGQGERVLVAQARSPRGGSRTGRRWTRSSSEPSTSRRLRRQPPRAGGKGRDRPPVIR